MKSPITSTVSGPAYTTSMPSPSASPFASCHALSAMDHHEINHFATKKATGRVANIVTSAMLYKVTDTLAVTRFWLEPQARERLRPTNCGQSNAQPAGSIQEPQIRPHPRPPPLPFAPFREQSFNPRALSFLRLPRLRWAARRRQRPEVAFHVRQESTHQPTYQPAIWHFYLASP